MTDNKGEEPRYTLEEARRVLKKKECAIDGHDFIVISLHPQNIPVRVDCGRCGESWEVVRK